MSGFRTALYFIAITDLRMSMLKQLPSNPLLQTLLLAGVLLHKACDVKFHTKRH